MATRAPSALASVKQVIVELHLRSYANNKRPVMTLDDQRRERGATLMSKMNVSMLDVAMAMVPTIPNNKYRIYFAQEVDRYERERPDFVVDTGFGLNEPQQFDILMNHLLVDHDFRVVYADGHQGRAGALLYTGAPPFLRMAGFPTNRLCCAQVTLVRKSVLEMHRLEIADTAVTPSSESAGE